ncbi:MAG: T9SS type A sorting domain-containing protein [Candidatus Kapabacteria bacterium]|jgi:hypothetical protein|nr:T9SS type A sorting domain-containing protein [Candidatus Kapabacteria bacterium]
MFSLKKNSYLLLTFGFIILSGVYNSNAQVWTKVGGTLDYVNFMRFYGDKLYVGSDAQPTDFIENNINFLFFGYGMQVSTDKGISFSDAVLTDYSVFDVIESPSNPSILLASARKQDIGRIIMSDDGGLTWDEETKRCEESSQIVRFHAVNISGKDYFYAAMLNSINGFRYSDDYFATCSLSDDVNINSRDLAVSAKNPKVMYLCGDNVTKTRVLCSSDGGLTWADRSEGINNYRILSVQTHPDNEAVVVVGADSLSPTGKVIGMGIFYSDDYGNTWRNVGASGASILDIRVHPTDSRYWAAAGGNEGVYISGTSGDYWELSTDGLPEDVFIRQVAIPDDEPNEEGIIVFASVYGNGIYKSRHITTDLEDIDYRDESLIASIIYPTPTSDILRLKLNDDNLNIQFEILDLLGQTVHSGYIYNSNALDVSGINSGTYMLKLVSGSKIQFKRFIKL